MIAQTRIGKHHDDTTVGRALPGLRRKIRDPQDGRPLAAGKTGKL